MPTNNRRGKQQHFEGMEPPSIKAIDEAAQAYVEKRDARMALLKEEVALNDQLLELMKKHNLQTYDFDGSQVLLVNKHKIKVKRNNGDADNDDDNGED